MVDGGEDGELCLAWNCCRRRNYLWQLHEGEQRVSIESSISLVYGKDSRVIETVVHQNHYYFVMVLFFQCFPLDTHRAPHSPCSKASVKGVFALRGSVT